MGLPKVTFEIKSDGLGRTIGGIKKVAGIVLTGNTVSGKIVLGNSYRVFTMKDVENLGIEKEGTNAFAHKQLSDFYAQAGIGTELWFMLVSDSTTQKLMVNPTQPYAAKLVADAKGRIRILGIARKFTTGQNVVGGLAKDSHDAVPVAESLAEYCYDKYMPIRILIGGNNFTGNVSSLIDYSKTNYSHVAMIISNNDGSKNAGIGSALGRSASLPSQRSIAYIKDNAIEMFDGYLTSGERAEEYSQSQEEIHGKRYIFFRTFAARPGYYYSDDITLTSSSNDFSSLGRGLVMDEAVLIAYDTLINELSSEVLLDEDGKIHPAIIKNWQANVERQLNALMGCFWRSNYSRLHRYRIRRKDRKRIFVRQRQ